MNAQIIHQDLSPHISPHSPQADALDNTVSNSDIFANQSRKTALSLRSDLAKKFRFKNRQRKSCGNPVLSSIKFVENGEKKFTKINKKNNGKKQKKLLSVSGLSTCKSVWSCPACSARILSQRAEEFQYYIDNFLHTPCGHYIPGRFVVMLTLTAPHTRADRLNKFLGKAQDGEGLLGAQSHFFGKSYAWKKKIRPWTSHYISGKECTFGKNGHHAHIHTLWFVDVRHMPPDLWHYDKRRHIRLNLEALGALAFESWRESCIKAGLGEPKQAGFHITFAKTAGAYISKWSASSELSSVGVKEGKKQGQYSMRELELLVSEHEAKYNQWQALQEYYDEFHGKRCHNKSRSLTPYKKHYETLKAQGKTIGYIKKEEYKKLYELGVLNQVMRIYSDYGLQCFKDILWVHGVQLREVSEEEPPARQMTSENARSLISGVLQQSYYTDHMNAKMSRIYTRMGKTWKSKLFTPKRKVFIPG